MKPRRSYKPNGETYPLGTQMRMVNGKVRAVYVPKTEEEGQRRFERAEAAVSRGFEHLPGHHPNPNETFQIEGLDIPVHVIEKVYNDGQLCNEVSDNGKDGPIYRDTINGLQLAVYDWAVMRFRSSKPS